MLGCVHTLRVAFSLTWLLAPERSSRKRWSMLMLEVLRRRLSGRLSTPSCVFFSCSLTCSEKKQNRTTKFKEVERRYHIIQMLHSHVLNIDKVIL